MTHIFYLSEKGNIIASKLQKHFSNSQVTGANIADPLIQAFSQKSPIIAVTSPAIITRILAPYLRDKRSEAPILIIDELGQYIIPLLGYHHGGRELAQQVQHILGDGCKLIETGSCRTENAIDNPKAGFMVSNGHLSNVILGKNAREDTILYYDTIKEHDLALPTNAVLTHDKEEALFHIGLDMVDDKLGLHPKILHIGIGLERYKSPKELADFVRDILQEHQLSWYAIATINSVDIKVDEPALWQLWQQTDAYNIELRFHSSDALAAITVPNPSAVVQAEIGIASVAEASALCQAGAGASLIVEKQKRNGMTIAIARANTPLTHEDMLQGTKIGLLSVVGLGPGAADYRTFEAHKILHECDVVVSYDYYSNMVHDIIAHKKIITHPLGQEKQRVHDALQQAAKGHHVALLASGDAGIYALAMLAIEYAHQSSERLMQAVPIVTVPGISAFQLFAARLGAPAGNDCCMISLSNIMTKEEMIIQRLKGAASGEFVTFLYNPRSQKRLALFHEALNIFRAYYATKNIEAADIFVAIGRQLGRDDEEITITNLADIQEEQVDMFSIVMIGNAQTKCFNHPWQDYLYAPRGYL